MGFVKSKLLATAISQLLRMVFATWTSQAAREWVDDFLDGFEDRYEGNEAVITIINQVRAIASIPDDIGGDED